MSCGSAAMAQSSSDAPRVVPLAQRKRLLPGLDPNSPIAAGSVTAGGSEASEQLAAAVSAEAAAREHLQRVRARVQRHMRRAASQSALESIRERKRQEAAAARADIDHLIGRDVTRRLQAADIEPATAEEVKHLSELLNQRMMLLHPDARNFFTLVRGDQRARARTPP